MGDLWRSMKTVVTNLVSPRKQSAGFSDNGTFFPLTSEHWPQGWQGEPHGLPFESNKRFPCIGMTCASARKWHEGTRCLAFRDGSRPATDQPAWQHMCYGCAASFDEPLDAAPALAAPAQPASPVMRQPAGPRAGIAAAKRHCGTSLTPTPAILPIPAAAVPVEVLAPMEAWLPEPPKHDPQPFTTPVRDQSVAGLQPVPVRVRTGLEGHNAERALGKAVWASKGADHMPRPRTDGSCQMVVAGKTSNVTPDMIDLNERFPLLPFIQPAPASVRALIMLSRLPNNTLTHEVK